MNLQPVITADLGQRLGQCRVAPVRLGRHDDQTSSASGGGIDALLAVYAADFDVDPYLEMFFFPTDTLKLSLIDLTSGEIVWTRDLGRGTVPGMWFCPVLPFDLDGDGVDEIYLVENPQAAHPLGLSHYRLTRLDARTGEVTGHIPWPQPSSHQALSHVFRFFLVGGHVQNQPVLVSAQGTYGPTHFQAWTGDLQPFWQTTMTPGFNEHGKPCGAMGSHMSPVVDLNQDGDDELLWGEHCFSLRDGQELWCADRDTWPWHSDVIQPVWDRESKTWSVFTARENDVEKPPRLVMYDANGKRKWHAVERGHMDMGWTARLKPNGNNHQYEHVCLGVAIDHKTCGPDGRHHTDPKAHAFVANTGEPFELPFNPYGTLPVDLDGDGGHELVYGLPGQDGRVIDRQGQTLGSVRGPVAALSKLLDLPGEQAVTFHPDGTLRIWADRDAHDSDAAKQRYAHPAYRTQQRLTATGYNLINLGGL